MNNVPITYIEESVKMKWTRDYFYAEESKVGAEPLRAAYGVM